MGWFTTNIALVSISKFEMGKLTPRTAGRHGGDAKKDANGGDAKKDANVKQTKTILDDRGPLTTTRATSSRSRSLYVTLGYDY